jgi:hypothetical protein
MMGSLCGLKLREALDTFGEVALGRCTQLLGCNTLFHGAPGTLICLPSKSATIEGK